MVAMLFLHLGCRSSSVVELVYVGILYVRCQVFLLPYCCVWFVMLVPT